MPVYNRKPYDSILWLEARDVKDIHDLHKEFPQLDYEEILEAEASRLMLLALDRYADYLTAHAKLRTSMYADESPYIREFLSYLDILMHEFPDIELGYVIVDKLLQVEQGYTVGSSFCPKCFHEMVQHWQHKNHIEHIGHTRQTLDALVDFLDEKPSKVH